MNPIIIQIAGTTQLKPSYISDQFCNTSLWPEFEGYSILPGVKNAEYEVRTPNMVGSRIRVESTDGSRLIEEILEWDPEKIIRLEMKEFSTPLALFATHFIEEWRYDVGPGSTTTKVQRSMEFFPKGLMGRIFLKFISTLMLKSFLINAEKYGILVDQK